MAQQTLDLIVRQHRFQHRPCRTNRVSLVASLDPEIPARLTAAAHSLGVVTMGRLIARYGRGALHILQVIHDDPSLGDRVCPHHDERLAEVVHAVRHDLACSVTDVLARRLPITWSPCHGLDGLLAVATLVAREGPAGSAPLVARQGATATARLVTREGSASSCSVEQHAAAYRTFVADGLSFRTPV
jgi:glycerol-3-phosphate dehydrogenase